jgi:hypothetical protein
VPPRLQEVRYEEGFGPPGYHSQIQHVMDLLRREGGGRYAHFAYQPAMTFYEPPGKDTRAARVRHEEGLAIISRCGADVGCVCP